MKIDKIVFSSSEKFSPHWNYQSEVWSRMGIEPVLLLWGKKSSDLHEKYGKIIEMEYSPDAIKSLQMTWSKVQHTLTEPDTTWMIGDMDLYPLQKFWFTDMIKDTDENAYVHLAASNLSFGSSKRWWTHGGAVNGGHDLTAYYMVAKGSVYNDIYKLDKMNLVEYVNHIVSTGKYGVNIPDQCKGMDPKEVAKFTGMLANDWTVEPYWCADENYMADTLWQRLNQGTLNFVGFQFPFIFDWNRPQNSMRIDRYFWNGKNYTNVDLHNLRTNRYIDFHCHRDFHAQKEDMEKILRIAGMIK